MKKATIASVFSVLVAFFFGVGIAHAQFAVLITGQSAEETYSTDNFSTAAIVQGIGTDLRGDASSLKIKMRGVVTSGGILEIRYDLRECTDATYTTCTPVAETEFGSPVWPVGTTVQTYTLQFTTAYTMNPDMWYEIQLTGTDTITLTTTSMRVVGTDLPVYFRGEDQMIVANDGGMEAMYYDLIGEYNSQGLSIGNATSSSMFSNQTASTTLENLAEQCSTSGNFFAEAICIAFAFLFTPSPAILTQWAELWEVEMPAKFPFTWMYGVSDTFDTLTASSTDNMIVLGMDFASVDPSVDSAFGPILPNATLMSSTTITQFMPAGFWTLMQTVITFALWFGFGLFVFHDAPIRFLKRDNV